MTEHDAVTYPKGYTSHPSKIEVINLTRGMTFGPGNAVKYVLRRDHKGEALENIDKAIWYLTDAIDQGIVSPLRPRLVETATHFIAAEPNATVIQFLLAMFSPRGGWRLLPESDLIGARDVLFALREEYS